MSFKIKQRRLNLLGHILRLNNKTPVQQALEINTETTRRKKGRPKQTWEATIVKDLIDIIPEMTNKLDSKTLEMLKELASDREVWGRIVKRSMSSTKCMNTWNDH